MERGAGGFGYAPAEGHARFGAFLPGADLFDCQVRRGLALRRGGCAVAHFLAVQRAAKLDRKVGAWQTTSG